MSTPYVTYPAAVLMSEVEREKIREQLDRLLETHHFKNSRRYPALLRFVVEETLEGRGEFLKERLLGVRVFDRPTDYDTATDPIVRVTIAEIRKRIAQYYHDEAHDAEMRIELLPGRYAPEFRLRGDKTLQPVAEPALLEVVPVAVPAGVRWSRLRRFKLHPWLWSSAAVVALCLACVPLIRWQRPSAVDQLWAPFLESRQIILFCVPTDVGKTHGPIVQTEDAGQSRAEHGGAGATTSGPTFLAYESLGQNVVYSDMLATLRIADVLASHRHEYRVKLNVATNLEDLRQGPAIMIGGLDNQWTMRALSPLRFHFAGSDEDRYWIADRDHADYRGWSLDLKQHLGEVTRDFAIIARLHNEQTGQPEFIVAGIGMSGTAAAGEFIANTDRVLELSRRIGPQFKDHDFEAVLSTDVVNGIAGSPRIVAVASW